MIVLLVRILRVLVVLFLVRLIVQAASSFFRRPRVAARPDARGGVDMVRDRVCNTFLPRERALRATIAGREEHFCSAACRDQAASLSQAS